MPRRKTATVSSGDWWLDYLGAMHLIAPGELSPRVPITPPPVSKPKQSPSIPPPATITHRPEPVELSPDQLTFIDRLARKFAHNDPKFSAKFREELKEALPDGKKLNAWCEKMKREIGAREITILKTFYDAAEGLRDPEVSQIRDDCENFMMGLGTRPDAVRGLNPRIM